MLSVNNIKKDLWEDSFFLYNTTSRISVKRRNLIANIDATNVSNVQIFLQNCIFLETTTSIISSGKDVPKTTKKKGEGGGWWLDKRVRCRDGCIVSCRRCSAAASAALQIALSVFAEFLPLSPLPPLPSTVLPAKISWPPLRGSSPLPLSLPSPLALPLLYPFRFFIPAVSSREEPRGSNKSPSLQLCSADLRELGGEFERNGERKTRVNFRMYLRRGERGWGRKEENEWRKKRRRGARYKGDALDSSRFESNTSAEFNIEQRKFN